VKCWKMGKRDKDLGLRGQWKLRGGSENELDVHRELHSGPCSQW
jgi:hypothetical protein